MKPYICRDCARALGLVRSAPRARTRAAPTSRRHASSATQGGQRPFRLGIIGSGPAGFYSALRVLQKSPDAVIDMYEQLPTPFGLVRYGVAPDHPEVKNCQDRFSEVAESPRFNFIGNIAIGSQVPLRALKPHYDALLFAYGASEDKTLNIPREDLRGIYSARAFVGWYNGLPEYSHLSPDLQSGDTAMVIGNGNVALDIARILLSPMDHLRKTDISEAAIAALKDSRIKHVNVVGRRGPMQAAFTIKELRELMTMKDVGFQPIDDDLIPSTEWIAQLPRLEQRNYRFSSLLAKGSPTPYQSAPRTWALQSLLSPSSFEASSADPTHVASVTCTINAFTSPSSRFNPAARTTSTPQTRSLPASLAFRSIGYKSTPLPGLTSDLGVPFDAATGTIPNDVHGRVIATSGSPGAPFTAHVPGMYCAGWVKRGPTGVIASTMEDAFASADVVLKDWEEGREFVGGSRKGEVVGEGRGWEGVQGEDGVSGGVRRVSWEDWKRIDGVERERGRREGKVREKFLRVEDMLTVLD